ncbi:glycosyltransferase family 2 protein [Aquimarina algicola]|uniref:Glycosyltransferase family 2 protein n=1 Tax=Aquimarina algicola TaxID=2589995 RepID=A0A504J679_9FLAO|nr:glycosyltransferase family 2 protein [Aquimarina algicola]TPN81651.1 glycosyltransferase family 2 protein [Aquimarina algicola]
MEPKKFSIVISIYNEALGLVSFWESLKQVLSEEKQFLFELLWVNDGSTDKSQFLINKIIEETSIDNINNIAIEFSKNFGHESAMIAGIDNASGDAIICIDSDGQHPSEEIPKMINAFSKGYDIVLMHRLQRGDSSFLKKIFSKLFYKTINLLSSIKFEENSTDFFLISSEISEILKANFRDQSRFIRGFVQSVGFSKTILSFNAPARAHGESNYSYWSLFKLSFNAIFSFSNKPLRVSIGLSILFIFLTLTLGGYSLYMYQYASEVPTGYTTLIIFLSASFSTLFIALSIISLYFEKLIKEVRKRPLYIIKKRKK